MSLLDLIGKIFCTVVAQEVPKKEKKKKMKKALQEALLIKSEFWHRSARNKEKAMKRKVYKKEKIIQNVHTVLGWVHVLEWTTQSYCSTLKGLQMSYNSAATDFLYASCSLSTKDSSF